MACQILEALVETYYASDLEKQREILESLKQYLRSVPRHYPWLILHHCKNARVFLLLGCMEKLPPKWRDALEEGLKNYRVSERHKYA